MMSVTPAAFKWWNFPSRFLSANWRRVVWMLWNDKWLSQLRKWEITEPHQTADGIRYFKSFLENSALKRSNCLSFVLSLNGLCTLVCARQHVPRHRSVFFFIHSSVQPIFHLYNLFYHPRSAALVLWAWDTLIHGEFKWSGHYRGSAEKKV